MVRYSRVPAGRRARLRPPSRHGPLLGNLGQPAAPLTAPVIRNGFWHRLRGRGPFTVIPLGQLPEEQRSLLLQALCEEIDCQILAMSLASTGNATHTEATETVDQGSISEPPSTVTSTPSTYITSPRSKRSAGKAQLDAKSLTFYEQIMNDWKFLACLLLIVVGACAIGYIFRRELNSIHTMRIVNQIKSENKKAIESLYFRQVV